MVQPIRKQFAGNGLEKSSRGIHPFKAPRTSDLVLGWLRTQILEGAYPVGTLLPPERTLSTELNINRHTLRSALARLEAEGLVEIRQGDGVRVLDYRLHAEIDLLPHFAASMQDEFLGGVLALRRAIAVEAIGAACEQATGEQLARLDGLAKLQETEQDRQAFIERDLAFSRELVQASGNVPMQMLMNTLVRFQRTRPDTVELRFRDMEPHRGNYAGVVELLRRRDAVTARAAIGATLEQLDERFLAEWNESRRKAAAG